MAQTWHHGHPVLGSVASFELQLGPFQDSGVSRCDQQPLNQSELLQ